ncbi:RipA family octameric membrane protein [Bacillus subtilis]|uniref:RipA family octameric membrane protein n=1 Tax=Bacillus TaxID=1386 RepID=UPI00057C2818|nr:MULTISPECIES: hypothetical protein [Bacillus]MEC0400789.1 hypothetical protein [Bacillus subtilis]QAW06652.1 hypothetical protein ES968_22070 [Bacillus subtilis]
MSNSKNNNNDTKQFDVSLQIRNFEIELFWKRSLFFWGFIASAFVGFSSLYGKNFYLSIIIADFGFICSLCWTLVNRGSKFWQENWESKVENKEINKHSELFTKIEPIQKKFILLQARKYSVSKLAIGLSDYVVILWAGIIISAIFKDFLNAKTITCGFSIFTLLYAIYMMIFGRITSK